VKTAPGALHTTFAHLAALTDERGVFEHAEYDEPRVEHGYCVDDVARALIVVCREPAQSAQLGELAEIYLAFLESALAPDGRFHNRMSPQGEFTDAPSTGDWWGRAVWALGEASAAAQSAEHRQRAGRAFARASSQRSGHLRAMAFAGVGAAAVLRGRHGTAGARALLDAAASAVGPGRGTRWPWPEDRLRYGNGVIPQVLLAAGAVLGRRDHLERGLDLLRFLLAAESAGGHLSLAGVNGRGPGELGHRQFDQQPIEAAAIAEACACAFEVTADPAWLVGLESAWGWFVGRNDVGVSLYDAATGAGFDGLQPSGRNENRGAESTLAALATQQLARRYGVLD
jgi:hypothetical protein